MKRACIVTVDAARARIFFYKDNTNPGFELVEYKDLINPGRRLKDSELFSESRPDAATHGGNKRTGPNGNRSDSGEPGSAYDDHRDAHRDNMDTKFAKEIVTLLEELVRDKRFARLVLCAAPKMLGTLRQHYGALQRPELQLDELGSELSNLTVAALHDHLAAQGVIEPRQRLRMAR